MISALLYIGVGFALLFLGADLLVRGSTGIARALNISPLVTGLTIVAFGTSAPELAASASAAWHGLPDLAVGNVVGSNIANIGLILGLSALLQPLSIELKLLRVDVPLLVVATLLVMLMASDALVARWEGAVLLAGLIAFTLYTVLAARRAPDAAQSGAESLLPAPRQSIVRDLLMIVGGLLLLALGGDLLVDGATEAARLLGLSSAVIGLTIVAIGTSLPELATSLLAAWRRMSDLAVGNVIGSNIFNLLGVLGASALAQPLALADVGWFDFIVMLIFAAVVVPLAWPGLVLRRWGGLLLLGVWIAYIGDVAAR